MIQPNNYHSKCPNEGCDYVYNGYYNPGNGESPPPAKCPKCDILLLGGFTKSPPVHGFEHPNKKY